MGKKIVFMSIGGTVLLIIGMGIGYALNAVTSNSSPSSNTQAKNATSVSTELRSKDGKFTSPLLDCNSNIGGMDFDVFGKKLQQQIDDDKTVGKVTFVAVYLRHLFDGGSLDINGDEKFTPASLLKVPDMITLYKMADADPSVLTKKVTYNETYSSSTPFFSLNTTLVIGQTYTVDDLIERMIKHSDNEAMYLLRAQFDKTLFDQLYKDLRIPVPNDAVSDDFMTVDTYANFFRILYNASYLSPAMSEKALSLLTQITFDKGIVPGVPNNIPVAHKFGERIYTDNQEHQLHDCGIVYHPTDPYLLCVMTRGTDFNVLASVIKDLSKQVWNEMSVRVMENK
jgi:beta-lactamase class A